MNHYTAARKDAEASKAAALILHIESAPCSNEHQSSSDGALAPSPPSAAPIWSSSIVPTHERDSRELNLLRLFEVPQPALAGTEECVAFPPRASGGRVPRIASVLAPTHKSKFRHQFQPHSKKTTTESRAYPASAAVPSTRMADAVSDLYRCPPKFKTDTKKVAGCSERQCHQPAVGATTTFSMALHASRNSSSRLPSHSNADEAVDYVVAQSGADCSSKKLPQRLSKCRPGSLIQPPSSALSSASIFSSSSGLQIAEIPQHPPTKQMLSDADAGGGAMKMKIRNDRRSKKRSDVEEILRLRKTIKDIWGEGEDEHDGHANRHEDTDTDAHRREFEDRAQQMRVHRTSATTIDPAHRQMPAKTTARINRCRGEVVNTDDQNDNSPDELERISGTPRAVSSSAVTPCMGDESNNEAKDIRQTTQQPRGIARSSTSSGAEAMKKKHTAAYCHGLSKQIEERSSDQPQQNGGKRKTAPTTQRQKYSPKKQKMPSPSAPASSENRVVSSSSSSASSRFLHRPEDHCPHSHYICPISMCIMIDPVRCRDGMCYDRTSILEWWAKERREQDERGGEDRMMNGEEEDADGTSDSNNNTNRYREIEGNDDADGDKNQEEIAARHRANLRKNARKKQAYKLTSPLTNLPLESDALIADDKLRAEIHSYVLQSYYDRKRR